MKQTFVTIFLFISFHLYSQELINETEILKDKKFHFGLNFSTDICYRTLKSNDTGQVMDYIIESRNSYEIPKFGFSVGANLHYDYAKHLAFEAGIHYANCGYGTENIDISFVFSDPNSPDFFRNTETFHYAQVPVKIILKSGDKKLNFFLHASIIPSLLTVATVTSIQTFEDGHKERETEKAYYEYKRFNLFSSAGIGMAYQLNNNSQIRIEPSFKFGFLSIIDAGIDGYLWNGGINISYFF